MYIRQRTKEGRGESQGAKEGGQEGRVLGMVAENGGGWVVTEVRAVAWWARGRERNGGEVSGNGGGNERVRGWLVKGETDGLAAANRLTITHSIERVSDVVVMPDPFVRRSLARAA